MDKSWIHLRDRLSTEYKQGIASFLQFAYANKSPDAKIYCPCNKCANRKFLARDDISAHLTIHGFNTNYTHWSTHGERLSSSVGVETTYGDSESVNVNNMVEMVNEVFVEQVQDDATFGYNLPGETSIDPDEETKKYLKMLEEAHRALYPGCKTFTLLEFIVQLLHIKAMSQWSNTSLDKLLALLHRAFPMCEDLPKSYYDAKKLNTSLGFGYEKIDACPGDCMLYWKDDKLKEKCDFCSRPRYKNTKSGSTEGMSGGKKIPAKQLRYFPLKPRLKRLFMSTKTASKMRWHDEGRTKDGKIRHPADSEQWKNLDERYPTFGRETRNVRLGLASDGFNPFRTLSSVHSTWPVVLLNYNFPPWFGMKQPQFILCLLIDGPNAPGNDLDVYLQPLIEELNELWVHGIMTFDASSKEMFRMHAALLWTISDFPAYANLSGWSTKGRLACPYCNKDTESRWLSHSRKFCYCGSRRWLDNDHKFRKEAASFDGTIEKRVRPPYLSGEDIFKQVEKFVNKFGKPVDSKEARAAKRQKSKGVRVESDSESIMSYNWKKRSIFFDLQYWKGHLIRHNLDVMHIEKNICDNILNTLLDLGGKSKDGLHARRDLQDIGIREALHPIEQPNGQSLLPPSIFTMSKQDADIFCRVLKSIKVPDGYSSNISNNVKGRIISGLKSHDCHILLQQLLPLAVRKALPRNVSKVLIELSNIFRKLCSKVIDINDIEELQKEITLTLCHLEKIFPPSFFDVMEHLPIHLAEELKVAGPVVFRWMYPIERYLYSLKQYVRNTRYPEGSIAEGYLAEECLTFCSRYLHDVETKSTRPARNYEGEGGCNIYNGHQVRLDMTTWHQAHRYVQANSSEVSPFIDLHKDRLRVDYPNLSEHDLMKKHNESFQDWFKNHVEKMLQEDNSSVSYEVKMLSVKPDIHAKRYSGYSINGYKFHTKYIEQRRVTQNSGVCVTASTPSVASSKDPNPVEGDVIYYGVLTDIIELRYSNSLKFVLFKCDWINNHRGLRIDEFGFTQVNFNRLMYKNNTKSDEPFILASQAQQVWYVQDPIEYEWHNVMKMTPRDLFDMSGDDVEDDEFTSNQVEPYSTQQLEDDYPVWVRTNEDPSLVGPIPGSDGENPVGDDNDDDDNNDGNRDDDNMHTDVSDDDDYYNNHLD